MKDLVEAGGVPKSTILHYVNEGLLPPPLKTSVNMAYYDPACVERIGFVKTMQSRHRLPLNKIKHLLTLRDQGQDVTLRTQLVQTIFGEVAGEPITEDLFCETTGLKPRQVLDLIDADLLLPLHPDAFDQEDVALGTLYAGALNRGLTVEDLAFYPELGKKIVDEEMALRRRITHHLPEEADAEQTLRLVQAARATRSYIIDRLFQKRVAAATSLKDDGLLS
ncbi:MAG: MerR family transcriptional regulator [Pseudomonadota bacterium]